MTEEREFPKPRRAVGPAPLRGLGDNANVAREMVNMHLQGRNPQRHQTSSTIHARISQGSGRNMANSENTGLPEKTGVQSAKKGPSHSENHPFSTPRPKVAGSKTCHTNSHIIHQAHTSTRVPQSTRIPGSGSLEPPFPARNTGQEVNSSTSCPQIKTQSSAQVSVPATSHEGPCRNPQCDHCGTVIIPSPKATFPLREQPSISVNDWSIYTTKGPICSSEELDHLNDTRFDFPLPEMIFGSNCVLLVNEKTGASINFNTLDALDSLGPTADFKVAYYKEWLSTRPKAKSAESKDADSGGECNSTNESARPKGPVGSASNSQSSLSSSISETSKETPSPSPDLQSVKPYDWTYSTNYRGTLSKCEFTKTSEDIPLEKLVRQDPILFYDESILFEDELGDNGISMLSTKIRVMHSCLLLLCRFSMRVDDVAFRIRDTRVYVDLETNKVLREYKVQQATYNELLGKISGRSNDPKKLLRDSNWVSQNTPVVSREVEIMEETNEQTTEG